MASRAGLRMLGFVAAVAAVISIAWWYYYSLLPSGESYHAQLTPLDVSSDKLQRTVVVPTLDSPIPEGKSAIWCASFQMAWNRLKNDITKEPVRIANAQAVADRLNAATLSEEDLDQSCVYAAAGFAKDGIIERIQSDMAKMFPAISRPLMDAAPGAVVAYAYLAAASKFEHSYFENDEPLRFRDTAGRESPVSSFGVRKKDDYAYNKLRTQANVLYCSSESVGRGEEAHEFIIDLCRTSKPIQILVAQVKRKATLAEITVDVDRKIASSGGPEYGPLGPRDTLQVPNMAWTIYHRFRDLEGADRGFQNAGLRGNYLERAMQTIDFRLTRSGAELVSEAKVHVLPGATYFHVNRPFLVLMKKRDSKYPLLVMWIENAELLQSCKN